MKKLYDKGRYSENEVVTTNKNKRNDKMRRVCCNEMRKSGGEDIGSITHGAGIPIPSTISK